MTKNTASIFRRAGRAFRRLGSRLSSAYRVLESRHSSIAVAREAVHNFREHKMRLACAYFSYHAFIAVFALILLASAALGFFLKSNPDLEKKMLDSVYDVLPDLGPSLRNIFNSIVNNRGLVTVIGLVGLLWTGSKVSTSLETGFNIIQGTENRPYWKRRLLALGVIMLVLSAGAVFIGLSILYSSVLSWVEEQSGWFWSVLSHSLGLVVSISLGVILFTILLWVVPQNKPGRSELLKSALLGSIAFHVIRVGFNYYFISISKTRLLYGTIGVLIGLQLWLFLVGAVILYSGEVMNILMDRSFSQSTL